MDTHPQAKNAATVRQFAHRPWHPQSLTGSNLNSDSPI